MPGCWLVPATAASIWGWHWEDAVLNRGTLVGIFTPQLSSFWKQAAILVLAVMTDSRSREWGAFKTYKVTTDSKLANNSTGAGELAVASQLHIFSVCFSFSHIHHFVLLHMSPKSSYRCPAISPLLKCRGHAHCVTTPGVHSSCNCQHRKWICTLQEAWQIRSVGVLGNSNWKVCPT